MKTMTKFLAGAAGLAATMAVAAPASAQYYPSPYGGQQYGYGNQSGGVIGQILNSIINPYGRTGYYNYGGEQRPVEVCVQNVLQRVNSLGYYGGGYNPYGGYNQPYGGYNQPYGGYNQPYGGYGNYGNQPNGGARIVSVDRVERRSDGVRVKGTAMRGGYAQPYGQPYGYNNNYYNGRGDVNFNCRVRNDGRITDIDLEDRRTGRRIG